MPVIVRNVVDEVDADLIDVPRRADGQPYRFELVTGAVRVYDDTADGLLEALIPNRTADGMRYADADPATRLEMRVAFAVVVQVDLQAVLVTHFDLDAECGVWEKSTLLGSRDAQPAVDEWACDVPLVLVDYFYAPYTDVPRPTGPVPVADTDNLIWLSPEDPYDLLQSLHDAGAVTLYEAIEAVA
jgi:hypothetical protein